MSAPVSPIELGLRAELRQAYERLAAQEDRLVALQVANEGAYQALYVTTGGPRFDSEQPFGRLTAADADAWPTSTLVEGGAA